MATDVEIALEKIRPAPFEKLASDVLRREGYDVDPTGTRGTDGGKDALLERGSDVGLGAYSISKKFDSKLRSDAKNAAEHDIEYDFFVYVTTADPTGTQRDGAAEELRDKYGWHVRIIAFEQLRNLLVGDRNNHDLIQDRLGLTPRSVVDDHQSRIDDLHQARLNQIEDRYDLPAQVPDGPALAVHVIPNGALSHEYGVRPENLPTPPLFKGPRIGGIGRPIGDGMVVTGQRDLPGAPVPQSYTFISEEGWTEGVATDFFAHNEQGQGGLIYTILERELPQMLGGMLECLADLGAKPPAFMYIALLNIENYHLESDTYINGKPMRFPSRPFPTRWVSKSIEVETLETEPSDIFSILHEPMNHLWQKGGRSSGSPYYDV